MNRIWKTLLWVAIGLLPGGVLLLPIALRRPPAAPRLEAAVEERSA